MVRYASLVVAVAAAALLATPALAAQHKFSCYDFAWQSQDMKDCLANPQKFEAEHKHMHKAMHKPMHKAMHKAAKKKAMPKDMKNMKDMPKTDMPEKKS